LSSRLIGNSKIPSTIRAGGTHDKYHLELGIYHLTSINDSKTYHPFLPYLFSSFQPLNSHNEHTSNMDQSNITACVHSQAFSDLLALNYSAKTLGYAFLSIPVIFYPFSPSLGGLHPYTFLM